jgi:hypothetical protein
MSEQSDKRSSNRPAKVRYDWSSVSSRMIADDVAWVYSTSVASQSEPDWNSAWGLTHLSQFARINHEAFTYLERRSPMSAGAIKRQFAAEVAAARHASKLLDDNQKYLDGVVAEFRSIAERQKAYFPTSAREVAVLHYQNRLVSTSRVADYHGVFRPEEGGPDYTYDLAKEMGSVMVEVLTALGQPGPEPVSVDLPPGMLRIRRPSRPRIITPTGSTPKWTRPRRTS